MRTELRGAVMVFLSMSYILVVNPQMMADAGMDQDACYTATILVTIFGCLMMGIYANYPVVQGPVMGVNAFFVYTVVLTMGYQWDTALAAVFVSGVLFLMISASRLRDKFIMAIPESMRHGITAGIGCFIVLIGLHNAGIVISHPSTLITLGNMADLGVMLSIFCIFVTIMLMCMRYKLAIFYGMIVTAIVGLLVGVISVPESFITYPTVPNVGSFIAGFRPEILNIDFVMVVASFLFVLFFDSTGTLLAMSERAELEKDEKSLRKASISAASAVTVAGVLGCTPCCPFVESSVAVESGSRTGLVPIIVSGFFVLALFVGPLFTMVDQHCIVGAMFMVGVAMISELRHIDWSDLPMTISIMATLMFMLLTFSISNGIAFGMISYCIAMLSERRGKEVNKAVYAVAVLCAMYLILNAIRF